MAVETLWFPLVQQWLNFNFEHPQRIYLVIDRTRWMEMNLRVVTGVWGHRGWPVYWQLLHKKGNSTFAEPQQALSKVLPLFQNCAVVVLGDRDFCSVRLARWLKRRRVAFCLRLKANEYLDGNPSCPPS